MKPSVPVAVQSPPCLLAPAVKLGPAHFSFLEHHSRLWIHIEITQLGCPCQEEFRNVRRQETWPELLARALTHL